MKNVSRGFNENCYKNMGVIMKKSKFSNERTLEAKKDAAMEMWKNT